MKSRRSLQRSVDSLGIEFFIYLSLYQSPNLPKKLDKFNNYMSNNFKVSDAAVSLLLDLR